MINTIIVNNIYTIENLNYMLKHLLDITKLIDSKLTPKKCIIIVKQILI